MLSLNPKEQIKWHIEAELCIGDGLEWLRSCINQETLSEEIAKFLREVISEIAKKKNDFNEAQYSLLQEVELQFQVIRKVLNKIVLDEEGQAQDAQGQDTQDKVQHYKESLLFVAFGALGDEDAINYSQKLSESEFRRLVYLIKNCNEKFTELTELEQKILEPCLSKCFHVVCEQIFLQERVIDELLALLSIPLSSKKVERLLSFILKKRADASESQRGFLKTIDNAILRYATQLQSIPQDRFEQEAMKESELLHHAFFIEAKVIPVKKVASLFLATQETGLTHDLQVDFEKRAIYIIANKKNNVLEFNNESKTVLQAARLSFERGVMPTMAVNLVNVGKEEATLFEDFNGQRGIVPLLHSLKVDEDLYRYSLMFEKYDGSFNYLYEQPVITIREKLILMKDIIYGLAFLHDRGFAHGDLHLGNLLYKRYADGHLQGALCDFGNCEKLESIVQKCDQNPHGYHSSLDSLDFSTHYIRGEDPGKTEMFILGAEMCQWYFKDFLPDQTAAYKQKPDPFISEQMKRFIDRYHNLFPKWCRVAAMSHYVKILMLKKEHGQELSMDERYEWLMFALLAPPETRLSATDARDALGELV